MDSNVSYTTERVDGDTESLPEEHLHTPNRASHVEIRIGMEFANIQDADSTYTKYAKSKGFGIIRRNSRENSVQFFCHKEGMPRKRKGSTSNDAINDEQRQKKFDDVHNHDMVSPSSLKFLRRHKKFTNSARCLSSVFEDQGIPVGRVPDVLYSLPEEAEFTRKDCYNYIGRLREKILDTGDAQAVYEFCSRQQESNSGFRYSIQTDEFDRMRNFVWVDARAIAAYEIFGEMVSFDTTYRTNKYNMPFAPFVGIDNHMHTIMFGCALIQDETEATFVWLFNVWLQFMNGKQPQGFITDQDTAIMNAVAKVFPLSRQRLCVWHINKKFTERLPHLYQEKSKFRYLLNDCIYKTNTIEQFEEGWKKLVIDYNLGANEWFTNLYSMRHLWAPAFSKDIFFGGMNTTGRSESINAFFNAFVYSGTTLRQFVHKYAQAVDRRYETFRKSEFDSRHKVPILTLGMGLEEHAASFYTSEIFSLFHDELKKILSYSRELVCESNMMRTYRIAHRQNNRDVVLIQYNTINSETSCECKLFESTGILCGHICAVLFENRVDKIPPQYLLNRWSKEVGRILWNHPVARDIVSTRNLRSFAYKEYFSDLACLGDSSQVIHEYVLKGLETLTLSAKAKSDGLNGSDFIGSSNPSEPPPLSQQQSCVNVEDPHVSQTKGRRKKKSHSTSTRIRSGIEVASDVRVRCSVCHTIGHNRRTCPNVRNAEFD